MHAGGKSYTINTHKFLHSPDKTVSATQSNSVLQVCAATFTKHSECRQSNSFPVFSLLSLCPPSKAKIPHDKNETAVRGSI